MEGSINQVMRDVVAICEVPVIVLLLVGVVLVLFCVGWVIVEYFTERRHFKVFLPKLVDAIEAPGSNPAEVVKKSKLLLRQKRFLIELTSHPQLDSTARESLAVGIEYDERKRYDGYVKITEVISRVAPLLGLLGTLIPLGPGIMALGTGDTEILSASLLTAFDTTSVGLLTAAVAIVITTVRKRWYKDYMVKFDAAMECILDVEKNRDGRRGEEPTWRADEVVVVEAVA